MSGEYFPYSIVQIAAIPETKESNETIYALMSDGTIRYGFWENNVVNLGELWAAGVMN